MLKPKYIICKYIFYFYNHLVNTFITASGKTDSESNYGILKHTNIWKRNSWKADSIWCLNLTLTYFIFTFFGGWTVWANIVLHEDKQQRLRLYHLPEQTRTGLGFTRTSREQKSNPRNTDMKSKCMQRNGRRHFVCFKVSLEEVWTSQSSFRYQNDARDIC